MPKREQPKLPMAAQALATRLLEQAMAHLKAADVARRAQQPAPCWRAAVQAAELANTFSFVAGKRIEIRGLPDQPFPDLKKLEADIKQALHLSVAPTERYCYFEVDDTPSKRRVRL